MSNQEINCTVENCKYNANEQYCALEAITVGCDNNAHEARTEHETICRSFSKR